MSESDWMDEVYDEETDPETQREEDDMDSGFLGSMLEAQLCREGQAICEDCKQKISSVLADPPNTCKAKVHARFKQLFDVRARIGFHDLKTRGYD